MTLKGAVGTMVSAVITGGSVGGLGALGQAVFGSSWIITVAQVVAFVVLTVMAIDKKMSGVNKEINELRGEVDVLHGMMKAIAEELHDAITRKSL